MQAGEPDTGKTLTEEDFGDFDTHDDSDVSLSTVIRDALNISVAGQFTDNPTANTVSRTTKSDGLAAADEIENVWAYADNGKAWHELAEDDLQGGPETN